MGNLDFGGHPLFSWYVVLLILSGIAMLGLSRFSARPLNVILNLVFGLGFIGYGVYLGWLWSGGTYVIFFKAFLLPVFLLISTARTGFAKRAARSNPASQQAAFTPPPLPEGAPTPPPPPGATS